MNTHFRIGDTDEYLPENAALRHRHGEGWADIDFEPEEHVVPLTKLKPRHVSALVVWNLGLVVLAVLAALWMAP